jgi:hypothetical protein
MVELYLDELLVPPIAVPLAGGERRHEFRLGLADQPPRRPRRQNGYSRHTRIVMRYKLRSLGDGPRNKGCRSQRRTFLAETLSGFRNGGGASPKLPTCPTF